MTILTKAQAATAAAVVRDETVPGANTATRVGTLFNDLVDSLFGRSGEAFAIPGVITPAQITTNVNDYTPTGGADVVTWVLTSDTRRVITGIGGGTSGRLLQLVNAGSFAIAFVHENTSSLAANRIITPNGENAYDLSPGESAWLWYRPTTNRWLILGARSNILGRSSVGFSMSADSNDLARAGSSLVKFQPTVTTVPKLTGMDGGFDRAVVVIMNDDTANSFVITSQDTGSTAANRFELPNATHIVPPGDCFAVMYDGARSRWRPLGNDVKGWPGALLFIGSAITSNQNNYNPTGLAGAGILAITTDAARKITGIAGGWANRMLYLQNAGSHPVVLPHEDTGSSAANRFFISSRRIILMPGDTIQLVYDGGSSRWFPNGYISSIPEPSQGAELTGASGTPGQTITVDQGAVRTLVGPLAQHSVLDIDNTNAIDDETITIVSFNNAAFTYSIRDHSNNQVAQIPASTRMSVTLRKAAGGNFANPVYTRL